MPSHQSVALVYWLASVLANASGYRDNLSKVVLISKKLILA